VAGNQPGSADYNKVAGDSVKRWYGYSGEDGSSTYISCRADGVGAIGWSVRGSVDARACSSSLSGCGAEQRQEPTVHSASSDRYEAVGGAAVPVPWGTEQAGGCS
jgi:hypothetical protein